MRHAGFALIGLFLAACGGTREPTATVVPSADEMPPPPAPEPPPPPPKPLEARYAASQIVVAWQGAVDAPPDVTRSEAEAKTRAEEALHRAQASEDFAALAKEYSDAPSKDRGGKVGTWLTGAMVPEFERAVGDLEVGQIGLVRTAFGWHVIRRDPVVQVHVAEILSAWQGSEPTQTLRPKEQAKARIEKALQRIDAGEDFATVARELSDDASAVNGGDIGIVAPGQMVPAFETAAFALQPGQHSGIVETPYGYHLILRLE